MFIKLNLAVLAFIILPFIILLRFYEIPLGNITEKISIDNTINYLTAAIAIICTVNIQYFFTRKKKLLIFIGKEKPIYEIGTITYHNNKLYAIGDNIQFLSISVSCNNNLICNIYPDINLLTPFTIKESESTDVFDVIFNSDGDNPQKIYISWKYKIEGNEKIILGNKIISYNKMRNKKCVLKQYLIKK